MLGTAFPAARLLLVEQPGGWGASGLAASQFDPATARQLIAGLGARGVRVLAIRRPGRSPVPPRRSWLFADTRPARRGVVRGSFGADRELLQLDPAALLAEAGRHDQEPVFAVCAHGTHDRCCAIEGRPVAAALQRLRPDQVWECSHVGGDRFAANVLVLPTGQLYGRVPATAARELLDAVEEGRVLPELLRGMVGLVPAVQAAVVHACRELGLDAVADIAVLATETGPDSTVRVRLATGAGQVAVRVQVSAGETAVLTCQAVTAKTPLIYRPVSIDALAS